MVCAFPQEHTFKGYLYLSPKNGNGNNRKQMSIFYSIFFYWGLMSTLITGTPDCFLAVHQVAWLKSVMCSCPHPLSRGRSTWNVLVCPFFLFLIGHVHRLLFVVLGKTRSNMHFSLTTDGALFCIGPRSCRTSIHTPKPYSRKFLCSFLSCWSDWSQKPPTGLPANLYFSCSKGTYDHWCYASIRKYWWETGRRELKWERIIIFLL